MEGPLTYIWIPKDKPTVQLVLHPIHLTTNDAKKRPAVNEHLHSVLLDCFVKCSGFLHVFEMIGQAATTAVLDSNADELGFWL